VRVYNKPIIVFNRLNIMLKFEPITLINRLMPYNWQHKNWPSFSFDQEEFEDDLFRFSEKFGYVSAAVNNLSDPLKEETFLEVMITEALKTSEIEGEYLSREDVKSSIRNNLGLNKVHEKVKDKRAIGITELMIDVRKTFAEALTREKLFEWHSMLFKKPGDVAVGKWREHTDPMQVVSGSLAKPIIHFEAPPSKKVPGEMKAFIKWFNDTAPGAKNEIRRGPLRAALAHLYFESIHPFEDGNGRIGRALAEKALSQSVNRPVLLSLSRVIEAGKKKYYKELEFAQKDIEVTKWIKYFAGVIVEAQTLVMNEIDFTLRKVKFFDANKDKLNSRQETVIRRMLREGPGGFKGGMNAKKYIGITNTSKATATRDLQDLADKNIFIVSGAARSTGYELNV
jgi:Fic family protein